MENEVKKSAGKVWLIPTIVAAVLLIGLVVFMVIMGKGTSALADGTVTLSEAVAPMQDGTAQLSEGVDAYTDGVDQVADGIEMLNENVPTLADGVQQLADGAKQLDGYKKDMNGIADQIASGLNGVRGTTTGNDKYKSLVGGANQIAEAMNPGGLVYSGIAGMVEALNVVNGNTAGAAGIVAFINNNNIGMTYDVAGGVFAGMKSSGIATAKDFSAAVQAAPYSLEKEMADGLGMLYMQWLGTSTTWTADDAAGYIRGTALTGYAVNSGLNTPRAEAGGKTIMGVATATMNGIDTLIAPGTKQIAGGIPTLVDTICSGLEKTAAELVDTKNDKSLKSQLAAYTDGVSQIAKGTAKLNEGVPTLSDGIKQLFDGSQQLKENSKALRDGASQLKDAAPALIDGINQLKDGAKKVNGFTPIH